MSRIVIYGIGSVLSKIKSNIVWSNIAAVIVCKDMADDCEDIIGFRERNIPVIYETDLSCTDTCSLSNLIDYDYVAVMRDGAFEDIKTLLIFKYGISEERIISWAELLDSPYTYNATAMYFYDEFIQMHAAKEVLDCTSQGIVNYHPANYWKNKISYLDRLVSKDKLAVCQDKSWYVESDVYGYDNVYTDIVGCTKEYDIILLDSDSMMSVFSHMELINKARYIILLTPYFNYKGDSCLGFKNLFESLGMKCTYYKRLSVIMWVLEPGELKVCSSSYMYVVMHKPYNVKKDDIYIPICVGDNYNNPEYINDSTGDNIAYLNNKINECTAIYWIWKNTRTEYVGISHYRRYMLNNNQKYVENILDNENVVEKLKNVDILLCEHITFNSTLEEQIKNSIQPEAYDCGYNKVREALIKAHPEDVNVFDYVMGLHYFYPCNMFATTWSVFDEYCQWLFSFIIPAACNIDVSGYNAYSKRVIGFFAERMMTVWVIKKKFKVEELPYITVE